MKLSPNAKKVVKILEDWNNEGQDPELTKLNELTVSDAIKEATNPVKYALYFREKLSNAVELVGYNTSFEGLKHVSNANNLKEYLFDLKLTTIRKIQDLEHLKALLEHEIEHFDKGTHALLTVGKEE